MSAAVRVGDTVEREAGSWTPTIHRLLRHLHDRGVSWVPRPLATIGVPPAREVLSLLPGTVPRYPMPAWVWSDAVLIDAGRRMAAVHRAVRDFDRAGSSWQLPAYAPAEVICHNDFAPYNVVFDAQHGIVGVIDWDTASPGPRAWDLAYLAYRSAAAARARRLHRRPRPVWGAASARTRRDVQARRGGADDVASGVPAAAPLKDPDRHLAATAQRRRPSRRVVPGGARATRRRKARAAEAGR